MNYIDNVYAGNNASFLSDIKDAALDAKGAIAGLFQAKNPSSYARPIPVALKKVRLDSDLQQLKKDWRKVASGGASKAAFKKMQSEYSTLEKKRGRLTDLAYSECFGSLGLGAGVPGLFMPGVAMIATHLKEKKGLEGLFVCGTRKAFIAKLEKIIANPDDQRVALIVASSDEDSDCPLHKMPVCIEKEDGVLKIALLDSFGVDRYSADLMAEIGKVLNREGLDDVELFLSIAKREAAGFGCGVFALQDAVSFLQDKSFFKELDFTFYKSYGGRQVQVNTALPPAFMIGAQSVRGLDAYKKVEGAKVFDKALLGRKKTLNKYLDNNVLLVDGKKQNHYITKKTLQYQQFIVSALKKLNTEEAKSLIHASLLT